MKSAWNLSEHVPCTFYVAKVYGFRKTVLDIICKHGTIKKGDESKSGKDLFEVNKMIIYKNSVKGFCQDVNDDRIDSIIETEIENIRGINVFQSEKRSWKISPKYMEALLRIGEIPGDCGVLLEYIVPGRKCRVDFILTGRDRRGVSNYIVMELKQWDYAEASGEEGMVSVRVGRSDRQEHPSYQAMAYQKMIETVNENVIAYAMRGRACVYLHNMTRENGGGILNEHYRRYFKEAPVFFRRESRELAAYMREYVGCGDGLDIAEKLGAAQGIVPYKLTENIDSIFRGEDRYYLLDEQRAAYEAILSELRCNRKSKKVIVVKGGAGTGKSILALKTLREAQSREMHAKFIGPNEAFRKVIVKSLKDKEESNKKIEKWFSGSAGIWKCRKNNYDCLIIDEAHRLKDGTANYYNGTNQIRDMINAARVSIFFVDDYQQIRMEDIGSSSEILKIANEVGILAEQYELKAQFRCAGADGFLNWILNVLQIEETANIDGWEENGFDCRLFDDPNKMFELIKEKNQGSDVARMTAGFAWKWSDCKMAEKEDVVIEEHQFRMPWNRRSGRPYFAIREDSINEIGCIHTVQGLEFDYVGVIIGKDLRYDPRTKRVYADLKEYKDQTGKRGLKDKPDEQKRLICNIYRILLSRGMKGCYIYCCDQNLQEYIREKMKVQTEWKKEKYEK